jgi:hypothetical protein
MRNMLANTALTPELDAAIEAAIHFEITESELRMLIEENERRV